MSRRPLVRLPARALWVDGALRRGEEATLSLFDRGARDGEGLFETLRCYGGEPFEWERHMERLVVSAAELGFPVPVSPAALRLGVDDTLSAAGLSDAVARVTVTRGVPAQGPGRRSRSSAWIEVEALEARLWARGAEGARVVLSKRPFSPWPLGCYKTTSRLAYHLARDEARAARAHEALLVSPDGFALEGTVTNLFAARNGRLATAPLSQGVLPGIARALVIELCSEEGIVLEERPIAVAELESADELFLTNSVQEVVPIERLEDRVLPSRRIGTRLSAAYRERVARVLGRDAPGRPGE